MSTIVGGIGVDGWPTILYVHFILTHGGKMFEVKSGGPGPKKRAGRAPKYPFSSMKIGDWFDVPFGMDGPAVVRRRITSAANQKSAKVTCRAMDGFVRCWRVA